MKRFIINSAIIPPQKKVAFKKQPETVEREKKKTDLVYKDVAVMNEQPKTKWDKKKKKNFCEKKLKIHQKKTNANI